MKRIAILSGGAAHGLVRALAPAFEAERGCEIGGSFGAVGAMRSKLIDGEPADILILTRAIIDALTAEGRVVCGSAHDLGGVATSVGVRRGDPTPDVGDVGALTAALRAADEVHIPDPALATAGIHVAKVLKTLGLDAEVESRVRRHPNGATAMRAMARSGAARPICMTQATEIIAEPEGALVGPLPREVGLTTVYTAALAANAAEPALAKAFIERLAATESVEARRAAGFE
jgi:molybdate transport system substrate-binding protein